MDAIRASGWWKRKILVAVVVLVVVGAVGGAFTWYKFFREEPQPDWITKDPDMRFKYGSIGAERESGIPYWIFYVLPRMFPDKLPKPGGLAALGVSWEQGQELPIGFTQKVVGFPRVANNCASCHAASYRTSLTDNPVFVGAGPGHTLYLEGIFRFLVDCAKDPRFNADNIMREIKLVTNLGWIDRQIYRFLLIPITKKRLVERETQFAWVYRKDLPDWGRGRDDAMNLTKYFLLKLPMDNSTGPTDMLPIWNLKKYDREGTTMNWAGDSHDSYSVIIDSALGVIGAAPKHKAEFLDEVKWLQQYLREKAPPKFPFPINAARALDQGQCGGRQQGGARFRYRAQGSGRGVARGLQRALPRRALAPRALSPQRLRAHGARSPHPARPAPQALLARLQPLRSGESRLRLARRRGEVRRHEVRYDRARGEQSGPRLRHRALACRQGRSHRVPEDALAAA